MEQKSVWDGDAITDDPDDLWNAIDDLGLLPEDLLALAEHSKKEGWVWEKTARYEKEDPDKQARTLEISRHYWRRAQRFKELAAEMEEREGGKE